MRPSSSRALVLAVTVLPSAALAHTGAGDAHDFIHGVAHPFGGLDHVLAMVTVGLLAFRLGGRALWLVPLAFVSAMALGGAMGFAGVPLPGVELGIITSVVVFGAMVALALRGPATAAIAIVALLAIFHGHAHGGEVTVTTSAGSYALGFILATALLHALGIAVGAGLTRLRHGGAVLRASGTAVALAGVAMLVG